jgi:uncharacterized protein YbaR (Trm112 family)/SAM-dependent methyltransferase
MQYKLLEILRCPVTKSKLTLNVIKETQKAFGKTHITIIEEGILFSDGNWIYPIIAGIPRLCVEAFIDYKDFLKYHLPDFEEWNRKIKVDNDEFLKSVIKKNKRTKQSFTKEWSVYDYEKDKTWNADNAEMLDRFLLETNETTTSLKSKIIFDAGCGNGKLNCLLGNNSITNIAMDFSDSIVTANNNNVSEYVYFIQGDVQFPPVAFNYFDIVHSSGVLIHTNNTELSLSCLTPTLKNGGKMSVFLYHPRKDFIHNSFNNIRNITSKLPLGFQYYLYLLTLFPVSYLIKKVKGNQQNAREMMIDILDWFTPEFRSEHCHNEVASWFFKRNFSDVQITTDGVFGFNTIALKNP